MTDPVTRLNAAFFLGLVLAVLAGCGDSGTGPDDISGRYGTCQRQWDTLRD